MQKILFLEKGGISLLLFCAFFVMFFCVCVFFFITLHSFADFK